MSNQTTVTEFILWGFSNHLDLQCLLFMVFLVIYMITVFGNLGMILLIKIDSHLHTPMYFFLSNLSLVDFSYSSVITPNMLVNFWTDNPVISLNECATQFFFGSFAGIEGFLLTVMAYDHYVAICKPLLYTVTMPPHLNVMLVLATYFAGFINAAIHTGLTFQLSFCHSNVINHFFCDIPPVLKLSCSDTRVNEQTALFVSAGINLTGSLLIILIPHVFVFITVTRIRSSEGQCKAFSTCGSHLTAVSMFYESLFCMYLRPANEQSVEQGKIVSVFCIFVSPMLNPFIYSLRNKDVKPALRRVFRETLVRWGKALFYQFPNKRRKNPPKQSKIIPCCFCQHWDATLWNSSHSLYARRAWGRVRVYGNRMAKLCGNDGGQES
nr:olfactory receptor 1020-like [Camelus dromedarius]